jgi:hypothetical protein
MVRGVTPGISILPKSQDNPSIGPDFVPGRWRFIIFQPGCDRDIRSERERIEKSETVLAGLRQRLSALRARSQAAVEK